MSSAHERLFVRMFNATDHWRAQRTAASGSGGDADLPDFTFASGGQGFSAEQKSTSKPHIYVEPDEVEALANYAHAYGMLPVIAGWFKGERAFYIWNPWRMDRTDAGTYRGAKDDGNWVVKIADPDGTATGIYPTDLHPGLFQDALYDPDPPGLTAVPSASEGLELAAGGEP